MFFFSFSFSEYYIIFIFLISINNEKQEAAFQLNNGIVHVSRDVYGVADVLAPQGVDFFFNFYFGIYWQSLDLYLVFLGCFYLYTLNLYLYSGSVCSAIIPFCNHFS